jgi:hypothetical protein
VERSGGNRSRISEPIPSAALRPFPRFTRPLPGSQIYIFPQLSERAIFTKVGYGYIGLGKKGQDEDSNSEAKRYSGQNRYDALIDQLKDTTESDMSELVLGSQLIFDFDDGTAKHDTLGRHFPRLADRGLGKNEISTASGDSGGPSFIDGKIAGISSWGYSDRGFFKTNIGDIDKIDNNGSFGEISGDTRVSFYASWIDKVTNFNSL